MTTVNTDTISSLQASMQPQAAKDASSVAEGQDRFLKLLVTQLKNQDPLNPLDNAQVTTQLAQLSTVSGIEKLNSTLQTLLAGFQSSQETQAAAMVGRNVLVPGSTLTLAGGEALGGVELAQPAEHVTVAIRDATGAVVHTADLGAQKAGLVAFHWDGVTDAGVPAPSGAYSFEVAAAQSGNKIDASPLSMGRVTSIIRGTDGPALGVGGIGNVNISQVRQIF